MKHAKFLFFISVRRAGVLSTISTLLLCLLIPLGALITGCREIIGDSDRDLDDLSKERLSICLLEIDDSELKIRTATRLKVKLEEYEGDKADLKYHWSVNGGEIHGTGWEVIYVAPKDTGTYTIICEVSNGVSTVSDYREVMVKADPMSKSTSPDSEEPSNDSMNKDDDSGN